MKKPNNIKINFTLQRRQVIKSSNVCYKFKNILRNNGIISRFKRDEMLNYVFNVFFENPLTTSVTVLKIYRIKTRYFMLLICREENDSLIRFVEL